MTADRARILHREGMSIWGAAARCRALRDEYGPSVTLHLVEKVSAREGIQLVIEVREIHGD